MDQKFWMTFPLKFGAQNMKTFGQLHLVAINFGTEQDIVNRKSALKTSDTPFGWQYNFVYLGPLPKTLTVVLTHPK